MAYATGGLNLLVPRMSAEGIAVWGYKSADAHTAVDAADYFSDGSDKGMLANDVVIVVDTATPTCTIHNVASVTAGGAATITAATLA